MAGSAEADSGLLVPKEDGWPTAADYTLARQKIKEPSTTNTLLPDAAVPPLKWSESSERRDQPVGVQATRRSQSMSDFPFAERITQSLTYPEIKSRYYNICNAYEGTFQWLLEKSSKQYSSTFALPEWLESHSGIFWMTGKTGSGKSTATKFILDQQRTRDLLDVWASPEQCIIAHHFFQGLGSPLQRSTMGFFRSIWSQILSQEPSLTGIFASFNSNAKHPDIHGDWDVAELSQSLLRLTAHESLSRHICIFIDGIDQMEGDLEGFSDWLLDLVESPKVKLYVSCRPFTVFLDAFHSYPELRLHDLTANDIKCFLEGRLQDITERWHEQDASLLVNEVLYQSSGIFLWADLVSRSLRRGSSVGDRPQDLTRMIDRLPSDFVRLYRSMLNSITPIYLQESSRFLKIAASAERPQSLMLFGLINENSDWKSIIGPLTLQELSFRQESVKRRIARCGGLLEVQADTSRDEAYHSFPKVVLIHDTVKAFLDQAEIKEILDRCDPHFDIQEALIQAYPSVIVSMPIDGLDSQALQPVTLVFLESMYHLTAQTHTRDEIQFTSNVSPLLEAYAHAIWRFESQGGESDWQTLLSDVFGQNLGGRSVGLLQIESLTSKIAGCLEIRKAEQGITHGAAQKASAEIPYEASNESSMFVAVGKHASALPDVCVEGSEVSSDTDTRPGYAESLFSIGTANSSLTAPSSHGNLRQSDREILVEFMLEDAYLQPLFVTAAEDPNIGVERLQRNLQRLLVTYSKNLLRDAKTDLERYTCRLVLSSALYVSQQICKYVDKAPDIKKLPLSVVEQPPQNEQKVHEFLDNLQDSEEFAPHFETDTEFATTTELDSNNTGFVDNEQSGKDRITESHGNVIEAKRFLKAGSPFEKLRQGLTSFAIPQTKPEDNQVKDITSKLTNVSTINQDMSSDNPVQEETVLDYPDLPSIIDKIFDMFSFPRPEPPVPQGARRIRWQCLCGVHLFDDYWELRQGALDQLEADLRQHNPASTSSGLGDFVSFAIECLAVFGVSIRKMFRALKSASAGTTASIPLHSVRPESVQHSDRSRDRYLLLCIDKGDLETKLFHHVLPSVVDTDRKLFSALRKDVHKHRNLHSWFTLKSINRLSLSKFTVDESDFTEIVEHDCQQACVCLPPEHLVGDDRDLRLPTRADGGTWADPANRPPLFNPLL